MSDDTMTDVWLTLEEAATHLGVSLRTLHRWIDKGKLTTRMTDGRRYVSVDIHATDGTQTADEAADTTDNTNNILTAVQRLAGPSVGMAQRLTEKAEQDVQRARRTANVSMSAAVILAMVMMVGGWWASARIAGTTATAEQLQTEAERLAGQLDEAQQRAAQAQQRADDMADKLTVTVEAKAAAERQAIIEQQRADAAAAAMERALEQAEATQQQGGSGWWDRLVSKLDHATKEQQALTQAPEGSR